MQVSPRLLTAPECSACLSMREWPWHAPAPVTRLERGRPNTCAMLRCRAAARSKKIKLLSGIIPFR
eukprot:9431952-Pyramimonas_sp.AAC.1